MSYVTMARKSQHYRKLISYIEAYFVDSMRG